MDLDAYEARLRRRALLNAWIVLICGVVGLVALVGSVVALAVVGALPEVLERGGLYPPLVVLLCGGGSLGAIQVGRKQLAAARTP